MKQPLLFVVAALLQTAAFTGTASGQPPFVFSDNDSLGFSLNSYGRLRVSRAPYAIAARQLERMSFIAALDRNNVFDYIQDADTTEATADALTDSTFECVTNNNYSGKPPQIRVRHLVTLPRKASYIFMQYEAINTGAQTLNLYLGAAILPRPSSSYGGETVAYDAEQETCYYFRAGQNSYWGTRLLNRKISSFKARDWDQYSSIATADSATDATRYQITADDGFDEKLVAGPNGSIYHHNAGWFTLAPGDTATLVYAVVYGASFSDMQAASMAAKGRDLPVVAGNNGALGFSLNSYGRLRASLAPYSTPARQLESMSFIAASSSDHVFDYTQDADTSATLAQEVNDSTFVCVTNSDYSRRPPKIQVRQTVTMPRNTNYFFIRYEAVNTDNQSREFYLGAAVVPRPSSTHGGETVAYDSAHATCYYFRVRQNSYWGTRLLSREIHSFKTRDWDKYSEDAAAPDSIRYLMTANAGLDARRVAGPSGSIYHHNAGLFTLAPGDTVALLYAVVYGASLRDMQAASKAATGHNLPTVAGNNGVLGFSFDSYGRLLAGRAPYSTSSRQLERMSFIAARDSNHVFDYAQDADTTNVLARSSSDSTFECITDNGYSGKPPQIRVRHLVTMPSNTSYFFIQYEAASADTQNLYLGAAILPRPSSTSGGETVAYDSTQETGYYFRAGEAGYWGTRLLKRTIYSFQARDWNKYSSHANADSAADSTRYQMTASAGFDTTLVAGSAGSIYHHNAGEFTLAPGETVKLVYAIVYGDSLDQMLAASQAAKERYITAVAERAGDLPGVFALRQNYPNPFNPSTTIAYELPRRAQVVLEIFDLMGRRVAKLVDEIQNEGRHEITWNGSARASGIYWYRLQAGGHVAAKKMLLLR